jgi:Cu/Ag efflux protein CusF
MRYSLLLLCLIASLSRAEEVVTTGYGDTFESALRNAKIAAIEKVTGTWINSEHKLQNGNLTEDVVQYNGGVIKKYEVLSYNNNEVKIKADVDIVKDNRVGTKSSNIPDDMRVKLAERQAKAEQVYKAVRSLDDKNKALRLDVKNIEYVNKGSMTQVFISGNLVWIPKWKSDVRALAETINRKEVQDLKIAEKLSVGAIATFAPTPVAYGFTAILSKLGEQQVNQTDDNTVCFSAQRNYVLDDCYVIGIDFSSFTEYMDIQTIGVSNGVKKFMYPTGINKSAFYEKFSQGQATSSYLGGRYKNSTLAIYTNQEMNINYSFMVPTNKLSEVDKFEFVIR